MNWQAGLLVLALFFVGFCALCYLASKWVVRKNRRVGLPAPKPDDRCSISNFRRIHTP